MEKKKHKPHYNEDEIRQHVIKKEKKRQIEESLDELELDELETDLAFHVQKMLK